MGFLLYRSRTQEPSHKTSTGQTREQLRPRILESRIVSAEPRRLPVEIFLMKRGTSMWVGQAPVQGASKQKRQRLASARADWESSGGCSSGKRSRLRWMIIRVR